jgi:hypothetical protein
VITATNQVVNYQTIGGQVSDCLNSGYTGWGHYEGLAAPSSPDKTIIFAPDGD